jgi:hypothetical protein
VHINVMKWFSIAVLLLTLTFWKSAGDYQLALNVVISIAAVVVVVQAFRSKRYLWAAGFIVVAALFNPVAPVFRLAGGWSLLLVALTIAPFAFSLAALRQQPRLSVPSITDRNPGSQSL